MSRRLRVDVADDNAKFVLMQQLSRNLTGNNPAKQTTLLLTFLLVLSVRHVCSCYEAIAAASWRCASERGAVTDSLIRSMSAPTARNLASILLITTIDMVNAFDYCLALRH